MKLIVDNLRYGLNVNKINYSKIENDSQTLNLDEENDSEKENNTPSKDDNIDEDDSYSEDF